MISKNLILLLNSKYGELKDKPHFEVWDNYEMEIRENPDTDEFGSMTLNTFSDPSVGLFRFEIISVDEKGNVKLGKEWKDFVEVEDESFVNDVRTLFEEASWLIKNWDVKSREILPGGHAEGRAIKEFNIHDLAMGIKVEFEHTASLPHAVEIAMDHLMEDKFYYLKLGVMEAQTNEDFTEIMNSIVMKIITLPQSNFNQMSIDHVRMILENPGLWTFKNLRVMLNEIIENIETNVVEFQKNPYETPDSPINDEYPIECTGDCVTGDEVRFFRAIFTGSYKKPKFSKFEEITGQIIKESYGKEKGQHTFTIQADDGEKILIKGRNLYKYGIARKKWDDEEERNFVQMEKHERGARSRRQKQNKDFPEEKNYLDDIEENPSSLHHGVILEIDYSHGIVYVKDMNPPYEEIEAKWSGKLEVEEGDRVEYTYDKKNQSYRILAYSSAKKYQQNSSKKISDEYEDLNDLEHIKCPTCKTTLFESDDEDYLYCVECDKKIHISEA